MPRLPRALLAVPVALLAVSSLAGCARFYWVKVGSTFDQFAADSKECEAEATVSPAAATSIEQSVYRECLTKRGYTRTELYLPGPDAYRGIEKWY